MDTRFFTYDLLKRVNAEALRSRRNRSITNFDNLLINHTDLFPIAFSMIHNDVEVRAQVVLNPEGQTAWIDMPIKTFDKLPTATVN